MTSTSTVNSLSGPYTLNFAYMDGSGNLSNITNSATISFNSASKTLTVNGTTYDYDYSWGKEGNNILILGSGGANGGYYALSDADVDFSKYTYENNSYDENNNNWTVTSPQGTATALPFDGSGNSGFDPCFLAGTEISVCGSLQKVEDLTIGGQIDVFIDGQVEQQTISWTGRAACTVKPYLPDDEAGYPVRILKDAISDGVPFKDMLITAEHCLFFGGKFVPARMLVNGRSIFFDKSITSYDYYHIETEDHSVIMADGMLTESYLDTGNRRSFSQKGEVISIGSRNLTWNDAVVPLTVAREAIEPIFRQIESRAEKTGYAVQTEARSLTNDNDLHLTTNTGATIRPTRQNNGRVIFMIPSNVQSVRIVSNASRPCDVIGPFVDDRRYLGVLIGAITLFESGTTRTLTDHLHDTNLSGWNNVEEGTTRWTNGNALLPLGKSVSNSLALMAIEVRSAGPYILDETISERQALEA